MVLCKYKVAPFNNYRHALRRNRGVQTRRSKMYIDSHGCVHMSRIEWLRAEAGYKWTINVIGTIEEFC